MWNLKKNVFLLVSHEMEHMCYGFVLRHDVIYGLNMCHHCNGIYRHMSYVFPVTHKYLFKKLCKTERNVEIKNIHPFV